MLDDISLLLLDTVTKARCYHRKEARSMTSDNPILVTGATGNTGRPLVEALVRLGAPVRAMVRDRASQSKLPDGVQIAVADFDDPAALTAALDGAGQAYLVTPSSEQAEAQQKRFADLAAEAGVRHLVV